MAHQKSFNVQLSGLVPVPNFRLTESTLRHIQPSNPQGPYVALLLGGEKGSCGPFLKCAKLDSSHIQSSL